MEGQATGTAGVAKGLGKRIAGVVVGLMLAFAPVLGVDPHFSLAPSRPAAVDYGLPSESTALALSLIGTAAAVVSVLSESEWVWLGGLTFGPSVGFFYGGCWGRGLLSSGLRLGATVGLVAWALSDDESSSPGLIWVTAMAASAVFDILTVKKAVHKRNASIMARRSLKASVSPFAVPKGGGIRLQLSF